MSEGILSLLKTWLICGFLGAGKTTFILELLKSTQGRTAVLVNEFGTLGIDGSLIRSSGGIDIVELTGGCICCSQQAELVESIRTIAEEVRPDTLLIEPSGVAETSEILKVLANVTLARVIRLETVVTVIDATSFLEFSEPEAFGSFFLDQVTNADLVLLNKTDLVSATQRELVEHRLVDLNPGALAMATSFCRMEVGLPSGRTREIRPFDSTGTTMESLSIVPVTPLDEQRRDALAVALADGYFGQVFRGKGFLPAPDGRWVNLQIVGNDLSLTPCSDVMPARLTLIGYDLDGERVRDFFSPEQLDTGRDMTQKDRLLKTLAADEVDRPPFICPGGMMTMVVSEMMDEVECFWPEAHTDAVTMAELTLGANRLLGIENLGLPFCMTVEAEAMGAEVDLGGREREPHVTAYAIDRLAEIDRLMSLDPSRGRAKVCVDAVRRLKQQAPAIPIIANLSGPVSLATSLVDPLLYYRALHRDKEAAHALNRLAVENTLVFGDAMVEAGADVVCIADPSATGELIGGAAFEQFVIPYLNQLTDHYHRRYGIPVIVHICGDVKCLGAALQKIRAEAVSVDSVVGIPQLKNLASGKVSMGNISTFLLEQGDPVKLTRASEHCLHQGVDILAPACGIGPRTPMRNILAVAETVRRYRKATGSRKHS
jgi:MtaA/CmuA family methyltransferase